MRIASISFVVTATTAASAQTVTFQDGFNGYDGTADTFVINNFNSSNPQGTSGTVSSDGTAPEQHGLLMFDDIFGGGAGEIPFGSTITSATITIEIINAVGLENTAFLHRMVTAWDEDTLTWDNALLNGNTEAGIQADGLEAAVTASLNFDPGEIASLTLDVTGDVQAWADGVANYGWAIFDTVDDSYSFRSSDSGTAAERPLLTVTYIPTPGAASLALLGGLVATRRKR